MYGEYVRGNEEEVHALYTRTAAMIDRLTAPGSAYRARAKEVASSGHHASRTLVGLAGVLMGIHGAALNQPGLSPSVHHRV